MTYRTPAARRRPLALAVTLGLAVLALAACGSSSTSTSSGAASAAATATSGATTGIAARTTFRNCLKAHGITLPNRRPRTGSPPPGGGLFGGGGGGGGAFAANPKFRAAMQACGGLRFRFRGARRFRPTRAAIAAFTSCVRAHGFPAMPSPNLSGRGPVLPATLRTNAKFLAASRSCLNLLRPPAGASTRGAPGTTSTGAPSA